MKILTNCIAILLVAKPIKSFSPTTIQRCYYHGVTALQGMSRPDSSDTVSEAQRISKEFGADSKEARVAWDIVEEMDANDDSAAFSWGEMSGIPPEHLHMNDYVRQIHSLASLLDDTKEKISQIKILASSLKNLEIEDPHLTDIGSDTDSDALRNALAEAKAACDVYGPNSEEARVAWEEVDAAIQHHPKASSHPSYRYSAAALKAHHSYDAVVDSQMLSDVIKAIETVKGLSRFVNVEKERLDQKKLQP